MRIDVKTEITHYNGEALPLDGANSANGTMNIGSMIITALNTPLESEKNLDAMKKVHRAVLSQQIHDALISEDGNIDIPQEDVVEIKRLMNEFYAPLPLMRAYEIFDPQLKEVAETS